VSRRYEAAVGIERNYDWPSVKLHEEVGERTQAHLTRGRAHTKGLDIRSWTRARRRRLPGPTDRWPSRGDRAGGDRPEVAIDDGGGRSVFCSHRTTRSASCVPSWTGPPAG